MDPGSREGRITMKFEIIENPSEKDFDFLTKKINEEAVGQEPVSPFAIFCKDDNNAVIAGCNGYLIFGSIYTDQLWVQLEHREKGIGKSLLEQVHEYGRTHGCKIATVMTMSFQAPEFYLGLGYRIDFFREGHSNGAKGIFLSKAI